MFSDNFYSIMSVLPIYFIPNYFQIMSVPGTVHQFITEIKMFSDNVCTVPTVVTVSSESAREKEGEH